jgi:hypothetical protein
MSLPGHDRPSASLAYLGLERTLLLQLGQVSDSMNMHMCMCIQGVRR